MFISKDLWRPTTTYYFTRPRLVLVIPFKTKPLAVILLSGVSPCFLSSDIIKLFCFFCTPCSKYSTEHSENKSLSILKTKSDLECCSPALNKRASRKNAKQLRQNQITLIGLSFVPLAFLQNACLLNAVLDHSRSDLVLQQPRLRNNFIFGMHYF